MLKEKRYNLIGLLGYLLVTGALVLYVVTIVQWKGLAGFELITKQGPLSDSHLTTIYVSIAWILLGSILFLAYKGHINRSNLITFAAFYLYAFLYLNILRERILYGDVAAYVDAAFNMIDKTPFHPRYLYPPLFATCLQGLAPLGRKAMSEICMLLNYCSLLIFFGLLYRTLKNYGFAKLFATVIVFIMLCVNVPIIRTLAYVQVNIHVANLILLT
jgi:hypothetical protein